MTFLFRARDINTIWGGLMISDVFVQEPDDSLFKSKAVVEVKTRRLRKGYGWRSVPPTKADFFNRRGQLEGRGFDYYITLVVYNIEGEGLLWFKTYLNTQHHGGRYLVHFNE
ncbi:hypothetical protein KEJ34_06725 [Candidatus Bathyarchaeota archaeon]|nr:hypothetical protein [Candidatus Bathyarchaeota archaeon]